MMSYLEQEQLKSILVDVFGMSIAQPWEMNDAVAEVFNRMLADSQQCTHILDMIPRVPGWIPGKAYLPMQVVSAIYRLIAHDKRKVYWLCSEPMKAKYRSEFEMASLGILR
ncbi:hypothetical protein ANAEL_04008 [Anaerolineales bacterium]|nr:hypothetical protein ANAEL_04008 [Anaerolineales bacterium]